MPYIKGQDYARAITRPRNAGELNYAITMLLIHYVEDKTTLGHGMTAPVNYALLNEVVGSVQSAKDEFVRRVVAPYEDAKIVSNGDVYPPWLVGQAERETVGGPQTIARPSTGPLPRRTPPKSEQPPRDAAVLVDSLNNGSTVEQAMEDAVVAAPVAICGHADSAGGAEFPMPPCPTRYQVAEETQSVVVEEAPAPHPLDCQCLECTTPF